MRRFVPVVLLLVALLCTPALAGASKTFKKYGFSWTMPSGDWQFNPVSPSDAENGFVAKAECLAASVEAIVYTQPTEGLSLGERVEELRKRGAGGLGTVTRAKVLDTTLSGVKGRVVIQRIKADGGAKGHFRSYAIVSDGKFYQLLIRTWHGAHESAKDEINGIRKGFRLLKGAGGEDEDEPLTEVDGGGTKRKASADEDDDSGSGDEDSGDDDDDSGDDDDGDWPAGGPVKEGKKVCLPSHNFEWTIPNDSPFRWTAGTDNEKAERGMFLEAKARLEREKKEFEKDTPDYNTCTVTLFIQPTPAGHKPAKYVKSSNLQDQVREDFTQPNNSKTRTKDKVNFGNHKAAFLKMEGKVRRGLATFLYFQTSLRGELYSVQVNVTGHVDRMSQFNKPLGELLKGIRFPDTKEPQAGPLLSIIPDFATARGKHQGKEKDFVGPGYTFTKPPELAQIEPGGQALSMNRDFRHAFEGRSEDGEAYFYFETRTYKLNVSRGNRGIPNPEPEKFIEKRGQDWLAGVGDGASIGGGRDGQTLKYKKGTFNGGKGLTYEFEGHLDGAPFIEQGWVVKYKSMMYWIKMQFGGKDAESKLKNLAKTVRKGLKFTK